MASIFVIEGTVGEYSDRRTWIVHKCFRDREQAEAHKREIDDEVARVLALAGDRYVEEIDDDGTVKAWGDREEGDVAIPSKLRALDRNRPTRLRDHGGPCAYEVTELEIGDSTDTILDMMRVQRE